MAHVPVNRLGIEMLTLLGIPPVEHINIAADLGCVAISTGLKRLPMAMFDRDELYPDWSLMEDRELRREVKAVLADTGVHIGLGEGFGVHAGRDVSTCAAQLDVMAELGARRINAISTEPDIPRAHDQFAVLAEMAVSRGMRFLVEFAPLQVLGSVAGALAVVEHVGADRCAMMLDAMHFFRTGGQVEDMAGLPIAYAQLADVPLDSPDMSYGEEAMFNRLVPGTGDLPLRKWIAALPADCAIGIEVPNLAALEREGPDLHARRCVVAARALGA